MWKSYSKYSDKKKSLEIHRSTLNAHWWHAEKPFRFYGVYTRHVALATTAGVLGNGCPKPYINTFPYYRSTFKRRHYFHRVVDLVVINTDLSTDLSIQLFTARNAQYSHPSNQPHWVSVTSLSTYCMPRVWLPRTQCAQCTGAHEAPPYWRPHHQANVKTVMLKLSLSLRCGSQVYWNNDG